MSTLLFQSPFNDRQYDLIGDDAATTLFRVDPNSGAVFINNALTSDTSEYYTVRSARIQKQLVEKYCYCGLSQRKEMII